MVPVFLPVGLHGPLHGVLDLGGQLVGAADVGHAHVVVVHALDVADEVGLEQLHQEADLGLGAAQVVFEREGVEGEPGQVDAGGGLDDELDGLGALLVAEEALEGALAGPAAVAVHDDGDVLRDARGIELAVDAPLFGGEFVRAGWTRRGMGGDGRKTNLAKMTLADTEGRRAIGRKVERGVQRTERPRADPGSLTVIGRTRRGARGWRCRRRWRLGGCVCGPAAVRGRG